MIRMAGFTAEKTLDTKGAGRYPAMESGQPPQAGKAYPAGLFRFCGGYPLVCCTCDLTNGGCDCSNRHDQF